MRSSRFVNLLSCPTTNSLSIVFDGITSVLSLLVEAMMAEQSSGSSKAISIYPRARIYLKMLMVEEGSQLVKKTSKIKKIKIMITISKKSEKIGKPRKYGEIIKVSAYLFKFLKLY